MQMRESQGVVPAIQRSRAPFPSRRGGWKALKRLWQKLTHQCLPARVATLPEMIRLP
jgi:hypothetical protein